MGVKLVPLLLKLRMSCYCYSIINLITEWMVIIYYIDVFDHEILVASYRKLHVKHFFILLHDLPFGSSSGLNCLWSVSCPFFQRYFVYCTSGASNRFRAIWSSCSVDSGSSGMQRERRKKHDMVCLVVFSLKFPFSYILGKVCWTLKRGVE